MTDLFQNRSNGNGRGSVENTAAMDGAQEDGKGIPTKICFNVCRKEKYHPNRGFKQLARKLKQNATVEVNREDITIERLLLHDIVVFGAPQEQLSEEDLSAIQSYVEQGGSAVLMFGDGHGGNYSYLNPYLHKWTGVSLNEDCVVRTVMHKYLHPKEVAVTNGVTNRAINKAAGKTVHGVSGPNKSSANDNYNRSSSIAAFGAAGAGGGLTTLSRTTNNAASMGGTAQGIAAAAAVNRSADADNETATSLCFVYPYGLTFEVSRPAIPILSSGFMAYPLNQPICVCWESPKPVEHLGRRKQGKLLLIGSAQTFEDSWLNKEENDLLTTVLFDYVNHRLRLNQIDADEPDVTDYHHLPDTASLSERLRVAVEQEEELPRDFTKLLELETFALDTDKIPTVMDAYEKLNVKLEPLTLIPPEFQTPLPPIKPAVFGPIHRDPAAPALDLFDLDEEFAPERVRLSQLTNKCKPEDVSFYIVQASEVMGVTKKLRSPRNRDPRALLDYIFRQVVQYKKTNQSTAAPRGSLSGHSMLDRERLSKPGSGRTSFTLDSAATAANMKHTIRVTTVGNDTADHTPFSKQLNWTLNLEMDYAAGVIKGSVQLLDDTAEFKSQEARLEGDIKQPSEREYPLEWGVVLDTPGGTPVFYVFLGVLRGNQIKGICERDGTNSGNAQQFVYSIEEL